jgi:hypothetical protein
MLTMTGNQWKKLSGLVCVGIMLLSLPNTLGKAEESKKLIFFGWNSPSPSYLRENIETIRQQPFEGVAVQLSAGDRAFTLQAYPEADFAKDQADLTAIDYGTLTDNFITITVSVEAEWHWTNPDHWAAAESNIRNMAKTGAAAGFKGILFDSEPYLHSPWAYNAEAFGGADFEAAKAIVREKGARFIEIVREEMPNARILSIWLMSYIRFLDPATLSEDTYALFPAFVEGMFIAAGDSIAMIDGNESAYYYLQTSEFDQTRQALLEGLPLLGTEYQPLVETALQVGQSVYVDGVMNLWNSPRFVGYYMPNKAGNLALLEHNVYHALRTADEYVWLYSENMNWWTGTIPEGLREAVESAKRKIAAGEPLGFDPTQTITQAREGYDSRVMLYGRITDQNKNIVEGAQVVSGVTDDAGEESACVVYFLNKFDCAFPRGWSGTIRVVLEGATFEPPQYEVDNLQEDADIPFVQVK